MSTAFQIHISDIISSVDGKDSSSNSLCEAAEVYDVGGADLGILVTYNEY